MKRCAAALGWMFLLAALGAVLLGGLAWAGQPHLPPRVLLFMAGLGAADGLTLFILALCFGLLPGMRPAFQHFGLAQGLWALAGTALSMAAGALLTTFPPLDYALLHSLAHGGKPPDFSHAGYLTSAVLAGELMAALFLAWYMRQLGPRHTADGSAHGIAWRPAPLPAYGLAALLALALVGLVAAVSRIIPPDISKLQHLAVAKLYEGPPLAMAAMVAVSFLIAPAVEEIAFRGIAFGGIASRLGTGWAALLTTLLFTAVHAPEKIYYPPGFIDVALLALACCWLRLRFGSIRPGIFLHVVYNTGLMLAGPLLR